MLTFNNVLTLFEINFSSIEMIPFDLSFHTKPTFKPAGMAQQQRKSMTGLIINLVVLAAHLIAGNKFRYMLMVVSLFQKYFKFDNVVEII